MDRLVSVDTKEVVVELRRGHQRSSSPPTSPPAVVRVTNLMHTMSVAVQLTTTRPAIFSFLPSPDALLPPLATAAFTLSVGAAPPPPAGPPDCVHVYSAVVTTAHRTGASPRVFSRPETHVFRAPTIPILLAGPLVLDSLLGAGSAGADAVRRAAAGCGRDEVGAFLRRAAAAGDAAILSALLESHGQGHDHDLLSLAVASGSAGAVRTLLAAGARVGEELDVGPAMHSAAGNNNAELIRVLAPAAAGGRRRRQDHLGRTPLHAAAARGHVEAARVCISELGDDPEAADEEGWTALHLAAAGGHLEVAELLMESSAYEGGRRAVTKGRRMTPFDVAVAAGEEGMYEALQLGEELHRAAAAGDAGWTRACLARGAEVSAGDQHGWTPLHRAAFKGRADVVRQLVESGARIDAVDGEGYTPLRCAAEARQEEVVGYLLRQGGLNLKGGVLGKSTSFKKTAKKVETCAAAVAGVVAAGIFDDDGGKMVQA